MLDLDRLSDFDAALAGLANPAPGPTRGLLPAREAPDQVRGGAAHRHEGRAA